MGTKDDAEKAIDALFADDSYSVEQAIENMQELAELIESNIGALREDLDSN